VRLAGCPWNLTLIYAPTNQADDQEKDNFYTCLQQVYQQVPKKDIVLLSGDFNAKIGTGAPIGKHALGSQNDNGERLVQFAQANDLVAANAMVRRNARRMYTWKSHDGAHRNQIDFILVQKRWWTSVRKYKSYPGADVDSDHTLVGMKFGIKLHKLPKRTACKRYDFSEPEQYTLEFQNWFEALSTPESNDPVNTASKQADDGNCGTNEGRINREWNILKSAIRESAEKTLAAKKQVKRKPWVKPETFEMIEKKRECKRNSEKYKDNSAKDATPRQERTPHCRMRGDRGVPTKEQDEGHVCNGQSTNKASMSLGQIGKSESGETLTEQDEIMNRWKNYCETLYSTCEPIEEMKLEGEREPTPTYGEVEKAIKSIKTGKAEGPDEIPAELLKLGGETVTGAMHKLITHVWITGNWPDNRLSYRYSRRVTRQFALTTARYP